MVLNIANQERPTKQQLTYHYYNRFRMRTMAEDQLARLEKLKESQHQSKENMIKM